MFKSSYINGLFSLSGSNSKLIYLLPFAFSILFAADVRGQVADMPENVAPPPVRILSKDEKSALEGTTDVKNRTRLALDLMEARLKKAETLYTQESYGQVLTELGSFEALMGNTLRFLNANNTGRGKVLDTYRKFEIALRAFTPRIELIRRELPERYEYHVRQVLKGIRDTRAKAIEPLFGDSVVPEAVVAN